MTPLGPEAAIRRRWATDHDRGAHDYTDSGCRVLAEHAFRDVADLLAALGGVRADHALLAAQAEKAIEDVARLREENERARFMFAALLSHVGPTLIPKRVLTSLSRDVEIERIEDRDGVFYKLAEHGGGRP